MKKKTIKIEKMNNKKNFEQNNSIRLILVELRVIWDVLYKCFVLFEQRYIIV